MGFNLFSMFWADKNRKNIHYVYGGKNLDDIYWDLMEMNVW
jgi:hypothetical protein